MEIQNQQLHNSDEMIVNDHLAQLFRDYDCNKKQKTQNEFNSFSSFSSWSRSGFFCKEDVGINPKKL